MLRVIKLRVTKDEKPRTWNVEPYGEEVVLAADDVLSIEFARTPSTWPSR